MFLSAGILFNLRIYLIFELNNKMKNSFKKVLVQLEKILIID